MPLYLSRAFDGFVPKAFVYYNENFGLLGFPGGGCMRSGFIKQATPHVSVLFLLLFQTIPQFALAESGEASTRTKAATQMSAVASAVQRIDEIAYWRRVKQADFKSPKMILKLKPKFREDILSRRIPLAQLRSAEYDDQNWIKAHQEAEKNFKPEEGSNLTVAGYDINQFVGYKCGKVENFFDEDGLCYKVYFDFENPIRDLSPQLYLTFMEKLSQSGFKGDSKIAMTPGVNSLFYNNVVVHAGDPEQAKLAESVGLSVFGSKLAHYARGVDVKQTKNDDHWSNAVDWHAFLAGANDLSRLSSRALKYVGPSSSS
jgi:hypothetical protein